MAENEKVAANAQPAAKKIRRGISNETKALTRIKFHEKDATNNGLFIGHLESVSVDWSASEKSKSFPNMNMPRLTFHFESNHAKVAERRYLGHTMWPVESSVETIPGGRRQIAVDSILNGIKHILDVYYLKGRELTDTEEEALTLSFVDFDEEGNYIPVEPEDVLNGYRKIFENAAAMLNGTWSSPEQEATGKPCYKTADGKFIPVWMKLLRHTKGRDGKWYNVGLSGELDFTGNPGNGWIEPVQGQNPPKVLRLDLAKESITPKQTDRIPNVGVVNPAALGGVVAPAIAPAVDNQVAGAYADAGGEMPF